MKNILLIIGIISFSIASAQNYVPFAETGATWRVDKTSCVYCTANFVTCLCSKFQYTLQGDTTVGSYTYKKIHRGWENFDEFEVTDSGYVGAIRQDIPNKKVYFLIPNTTLDTLLYDYNLNLGTLVPPTYVYEQSNAVITNVDSILLGTNYYKVYQIGNIGQSLIEGIGSTAGLIEPIHQFEVGYQLKCYSLESGYQHVFDGSNDCDIITGISVKDSINTLRFFPNPLIETSKLLFDCEKSKKYQLYVYNINGIIFNKIILCSNELFSIDFNKSDIISGIYFYDIVSDNEIHYTGKFLVQ